MTLEPALEPGGSLSDPIVVLTEIVMPAVVWWLSDDGSLIGVGSPSVFSASMSSVKSLPH